MFSVRCSRRLFFVIALLISGIPVFSITQIFGVAICAAIVTSFFIAAATALVTGFVAMAIAVLKVGTKTIFSFYLFIVIYLVGTFMLDQIDYFKVGVFNAATATVESSRTGWMTALNPFLSLRTIFSMKLPIPPESSAIFPRIFCALANWMVLERSRPISMSRPCSSSALS